MALTRPTALLLDAGNTIVFLDHDVIAQISQSHGGAAQASQIERAERTAKVGYERGMTRGMSHEAGWQLYMRLLFQDLGLSEDQAGSATREARALHDEFNLWRRVPPGLPGALEAAKAAGIRLGIISNSEGHLDALLARVGLLPHFELVVDSGKEGVRKPDPRIFEIATERLGVLPEDCLYAGDIPQVDVDGARAVGMQAVLIDALDHYPDYHEAPRFRSTKALIEALGAT